MVKRFFQAAGLRRAPAGLNAAERALWAAFPTGRLVDLAGEPSCGPGEPDLAPLPVVRAEVLARLLLGGCTARPGSVPAVNLRGARITGRLDVSSGSITCPVRLERCVLTEAPKFSNASTARLRFAECRLPGFDGAGLACNGYLSFSGSRITGLLNLTHAHVRGGFRLNLTEVSNPSSPDDWAVFAGGLVVEGATFIREAEITGGLLLGSARLDGGLFMEGTTLRSTVHLALDGQNLVADEDIRCSALLVRRKGRPVIRNGEPVIRLFTSEGGIRLRGARCTGSVSFDQAVLSGRTDDDRALHASHMKVRELILTTRDPIEGTVSLKYSKIDVLLDSRSTWPRKILLNGLEYGTLRGAPPAERLSWVQLDPAYHNWPYEQLAAWHRQNGRDGLARQVRLATMRARREFQRPIRRLPEILLDWTVGYGYRPWRAAWWFALALAVGTIVFTLVPPHQPRNPQDQPPFHAFSYALDLLMPIPLFGQRDHWVPVGWTLWLSYTLIASGWILATALIAGATRVLRPD